MAPWMTPPISAHDAPAVCKVLMLHHLQRRTQTCESRMVNHQTEPTFKPFYWQERFVFLQNRSQCPNVRGNERCISTSLKSRWPSPHSASPKGYQFFPPCTVPCDVAPREAIVCTDCGVRGVRGVVASDCASAARGKGIWVYPRKFHGLCGFFPQQCYMSPLKTGVV